MLGEDFSKEKKNITAGGTIIHLQSAWLLLVELGGEIWFFKNTREGHKFGLGNRGRGGKRKAMTQWAVAQQSRRLLSPRGGAEMTLATKKQLDGKSSCYPVGKMSQGCCGG